MKHSFEFVRMLLVPALMLSATASTVRADASDEWIPLFDGKSLAGWHKSDFGDNWSVEQDSLVAAGHSATLYCGDAGAPRKFRNYELEVEARAEAGAAGGVVLTSDDPPEGFTQSAYVVRINNAPPGPDARKELARTGSLIPAHNIYGSCVRDEQWFRIRVKVVADRVRVWVNDYPTVDLLRPAPANGADAEWAEASPRNSFGLLSDRPDRKIAFRRVSVRVLPADAAATDEPRASDDGYGVTGRPMNSFAIKSIPVVDYHVHMRGGMTIEKAMDRQAVTGIGVGVLRNQGIGWPLETDEQLREFLDSVQDRPVFVGLQVNDRDWYTKHDAELLKRLDFVLADTMIMPMPHDDSPPVKLFQPDQFTIDDPEAWMERYVQHNLRVLAEPITILANPTWLPSCVEHLYDRLWTEERMRQVILAALKNNVALEINANSGYPHDRFIRMAKQAGVKFTFGSNNFDDRPHDMSRCLDAISTYGLTRDDMYLP